MAHAIYKRMWPRPQGFGGPPTSSKAFTIASGCTRDNLRGPSSSSYLVTGTGSAGVASVSFAMTASSWNTRVEKENSSSWPLVLSFLQQGQRMKGETPRLRRPAVASYKSDRAADRLTPRAHLPPPTLCGYKPGRGMRGRCQSQNPGWLLLGLQSNATWTGIYDFVPIALFLA
jgi:hypothetical protein